MVVALSRNKLIKLCIFIHVLSYLQIWELVDSKQGYLTRNGLYKALALTALAQQGKGLNDKVLENYSGDQGIFNCFIVLYLVNV